MTEIPPEHADRIGGELALRALLGGVATEFQLGAVRTYTVIDVGYEDCNIEVQTRVGHFLVKIFASGRDRDVPARSVGLIETAIKHGVAHPRLLPTRAGTFLHSDSASGQQCVVMDFVDGLTFFELDRHPGDDELRGVVEQTVLIHSIDLDVPYIVDPWAVPNIDAMFDEVRHLLDTETVELVDHITSGMRRLDVDRLPHALIHGDLTSGNVMLSDGDQIAVLDFAVASRYPRIQELAVIAGNLMHGDPRCLRDRARFLARLYGEHRPLDAGERAALETFTHAAVAMEFLGSFYERYVKGNLGAETTRLMHLGRAGLRLVRAELHS